MNNEGRAYATLDYGMWGLDGSYYYSNGSPNNPGYVDSNYSNVDCRMDISPYPTITLDFSERRVESIPGLVIAWSESFNAWATSFRVTAYNASGVVAQKTVTGNTSAVSEVRIDLVDYSQIKIEILEWSHPYQRVRCNDIILGIQMVYTKSDLFGRILPWQ